MGQVIKYRNSFYDTSLCSYRLSDILGNRPALDYNGFGVFIFSRHLQLDFTDGIDP